MGKCPFFRQVNSVPIISAEFPKTSKNYGKIGEKINLKRLHVLLKRLLRMTTENTGKQNTSLDNLVMFPSAKNFPPVGSMSEAGIDFYLEEHKLDLENDGDLGFDDVNESLRYSSFEEYMNRHTLGVKETLGSVEESREKALKMLVNEQIKAINEAKAQIKYYLDEIEMFLPKRR